jgi:hypothetical protein
MMSAKTVTKRARHARGKGGIVDTEHGDRRFAVPIQLDSLMHFLM